MSYLYPASYELNRLSDAALALKIARHSRCSLCTCNGLNPPPGIRVVPDESFGDFAGYGSDDETEATDYLHICACGHETKDHGADIATLEKGEFIRRGKVAIRCDELLGDIGRLLDFDYTDEDIDSLHLQLQIPEQRRNLTSYGSTSPHKHILSPSSIVPTGASQPPPKRQRLSMSPLSEAEDDKNDDDDDDDEDRPLASIVHQAPSGANGVRNGIRPAGSRTGKKLPSKMSIAHTAPPSHQATRSNGVDGNNKETFVKREDRLDEGQLTRLATGVTVDTGAATPRTTTSKVEKAVYTELRQGIIRIIPVENDRTPRSLIILTGLKTLFQKQLPKMPREYIARLVYDANSKGLAIIKYGYKVVGGICYRPFPQRGFAEIVFFATASVDQIKGYGGTLMNHFKNHIRKTYHDMMYFLTYADNYAVGYFKKQGFSKEITLDRSVWAGYIKDYEGGTIMQCKMLPKVDYLKLQELIAEQREAVSKKIREMSKSHIVHPGLPQFQEGAEIDLSVPVDPKTVPGLRETGWSPDMQLENQKQTSRSPQYTVMRRLLTELQTHPQAWAFQQPVNGDEVPDYYVVIKEPMDFSTMEHKLENNQYSGIDAFVHDANLVFKNCKAYNQEGSNYVKNATKLEKFLKDLLDDVDLS